MFVVAPTQPMDAPTIRAIAESTNAVLEAEADGASSSRHVVPGWRDLLGPLVASTAH